MQEVLLHPLFLVAACQQVKHACSSTSRIRFPVLPFRVSICLQALLAHVIVKARFHLEGTKSPEMALASDLNKLIRVGAPQLQPCEWHARVWDGGRQGRGQGEADLKDIQHENQS